MYIKMKSVPQKKVERVEVKSFTVSYFTFSKNMLAVMQ